MEWKGTIIMFRHQDGLQEGGSKAWAWKLMADLAPEPALTGRSGSMGYRCQGGWRRTRSSAVSLRRKEAAGRWDYKVAYS